MAVSCHPAEGVFVISFWQGDVCTGTFRFPLADGASLISAVAHGMAGGLHPEPVTDGPPAESVRLRLVDELRGADEHQ
ncbi:MAG: hypothetical protein ACR2KK_05790 [Acidimicrobiales bacterium]